MPDPSDAAALVTTGILEQAVTQMPDSVDEDVAAQIAAPSTEEVAVAEPPQETATAGEEVLADMQADPKFVLEPELPEELREELETPDFEAEAEEEVTQFNPEPESTVEEYEWDEQEESDPRLLAERKARIAAEKKAAHYEQLRVRADKSKWTEEALKFFPLSKHALESISATSRRGFLRDAKAAHEAVLPYVREALLAHEASLEAERTRVADEERAKAAERWGPAVSGAGAVPAQADDFQAEYEDAKKKGQLDRMIGVLRKRALQEGGE